MKSQTIKCYYSFQKLFCLYRASLDAMLASDSQKNEE